MFKHLLFVCLTYSFLASASVKDTVAIKVHTDTLDKYQIKILDLSAHSYAIVVSSPFTLGEMIGSKIHITVNRGNDSTDFSYTGHKNFSGNMDSIINEYENGYKGYVFYRGIYKEQYIDSITYENYTYTLQVGNCFSSVSIDLYDNRTTKTDTTVIDSSTSILPISSYKGVIKMCPNPAGSYVTLYDVPDVGSSYHLTILESSGSKVIEKKVYNRNGKIDLNFSKELSSGVYLVGLRNHTTNLWGRLVVR